MVKKVSKRVSEIVFLMATGGEHLLSDRDWFPGLFPLDDVCAWRTYIDILQFSG